MKHDRPLSPTAFPAVHGLFVDSMNSTGWSTLFIDNSHLEIFLSQDITTYAAGIYIYSYKNFKSVKEISLNCNEFNRSILKLLLQRDLICFNTRNFVELSISSYYDLL